MEEHSEGAVGQRQTLATKITLYGIGLVFAIVMLFPFYWMIVTSLRPPGHEADLSFIPRPYLAFENYARAWRARDFTQYTINSTFIAGVGTVITVFLNSLAGFAFAKYKFRGREILFYAVLATMTIPFQITMIPVFRTLANLNLVDSPWGVILPSTASAFGIFLIRQYMQSIPDDLLDAARMDGATEFGIFFRIVVPLALPAIAVLTIFTFLWRWNDFLLPLLVLLSPDKQTLPIGIALFVGEYRADWPAAMAVSLISIIPTVIIFIAFQRFFVSGVALTGMKG
jgi:ABC-type glycerol-3-phosphate transport system permease component